MGRCKEELNQFADAKKIYESLNRDYRTFADPLERLAAMALRDSRPNIINNEARDHLMTIVEFDPNNVRAWIELANVYARCGQWAQADETMRKAQEKARNGDGSLYARVSLGNYQLQSAQRKEGPERDRRIAGARKEFGYALKNNKNCIAAANGIALCWLLNGDVKEAKDQLQIIKDYNDGIIAYENLGHACMKEQQYSKAKGFFENANRNFRDKTDVNLLTQTYNACKGENKFTECLVIAQQLCSLRPEDPLNWYDLATSLYRVVVTEYNRYRGDDKSRLRERIVIRWIKQLNRSISIYEYLLNEPKTDKKQKESIEKKIKEINDSMKKFRQLQEDAKEIDRKREEQFRGEIVATNVDVDPHKDMGRPR